MGYFPNGESGDWYEETYCTKCIHYDEDNGGCAVFMAHLLHNYEECNNKDSILHLLIPRDEKGFNEECRMFFPASSVDGG
jgi:hypothetical protein